MLYEVPSSRLTISVTCVVVVTMEIFLVAFKSPEFLAGFISQPEGRNKKAKAGISMSGKNLCIGVGK